MRPVKKRHASNRAVKFRGALIDCPPQQTRLANTRQGSPRSVTNTSSRWSRPSSAVLSILVHRIDPEAKDWIVVLKFICVDTNAFRVQSR
jgi:hypothetical protein